MKKTILSIALALVAVAVNAAPRTAEQALDIAKRFVGESFIFSGNRKAALTLAPTATAQMARGTGASVETPAYYVCNVEGEGFVIVSGDDRFKEILGYSTNGTYDQNNMPDGFAYWMQFLSNEMETAIANGYEPSNITTPAYAANAGQSVEPLVKTKWNQNSPYNKKLNGNMTGCVATGMAQVMNYWKYPTHGTGSHTGAYSPNFFADFSATTYDWANMLNMYGYDKNLNPGGGWESNAEVDAVATLMLHCGVATDMQWGKDQSATANMYAAHALISFFNYNKYLYSESRDHVSLGAWKALLIDQLQTGHPLCYSGQSGNVGHFFVCDGYDATTGKFHFNWGWSGMYDGYYEITSLEPGTGGIGAGMGSYNSMQQIFVNMQPTVTGSASVHFEAGNVAMTASNKNVNVTVTTIDNNNTQTVKGSIGVAVYGTDGTLVKYVSVNEFPMSGLHIGATYSGDYKYTANMNGIANGTYTVCAAVGMEDIDGIFPVRAKYDNTTYYTMKVTSTGITLTAQNHNADLTITSVALTSNSEGNMFQNVMATFDVTVKNNSAQEFNDEIGVNISGGRGSSQNLTVPATIGAGETKTIKVYGTPTLTVKDGYTVKGCYGNNGTYTATGNGVILNIKDESLAGIDDIVEDIKPENTNAPMFNIAGQRVNGNAKGIVIKEGKKVVK